MDALDAFKIVFSVGLGYYVLKNALKGESLLAELVVHNVTNNEPSNKTKQERRFNTR